MKIFPVIAATFAFCLPTLAWAANGDLGIFKSSEPYTMRVLEGDGTVTTERSALSYGENLLLNARKTPFAWVGDFISGNGRLEQVGNPEEYGDTVQIMDEEALVIDNVRVLKQYARFIVTVGDILPNKPGREIVVCHTNHRPARIRIFSYDEATLTPTWEQTFQPFPELTDARIQGGCSDLKIDDIDGDGVKELLAANRQTDVGDIFVFNALGERERTITLEQASPEGKLFFNTIDMDGDGDENEIVSRVGDSFRDYSRDLRVNDQTGQHLLTIPTSQFTYFDYALGDVTGDGQEEVIVMNGIKSYLTLWSLQGEEKSLGALYPNSTKNRFRRLVAGEFGTILD